jgi:hypothetical protein
MEENILEKPDKEELQWYYRAWVIVIAILCFGPLGLFPLWFRPRTKMWVKVAVSVAVIALTILMIQQTAKVYEKILDYYKELGDVI